MKRYRGNKNSKVWLVGDSAPARWENILLYPFDEKHPIVHNIWTPIIYKIQKLCYNNNIRLIDDDNFFVINAVEHAVTKPKNNLVDWSKNIDLSNTIAEMQNEIQKYKPEIIITFGAFSYEFMRRSLDIEPKHAYIYWGSKQLGNEFRENVIDKTIIPLLHRSIAGGNFIKSHENFTKSTTENYFNYVAEQLYKRILKLDLTENLL